MKQFYVNALNVGSNPFAGQGFGHATSIGKSMAPQAFGHITNGVQAPKFGDVLGGLANNLNTTMKAPDTMLREHALYGTHEIHDIMIANSKAELAVNLTAQFTTKVMQAYDRILQIQV
ncbi:MAG: flagellar hook-basal body complex protein FliE [Vampirovibrionales bacterium]|nr:flagellar hook-basal body complex protein FliE [Vampirovibrionales bacterium]